MVYVRGMCVCCCCVCFEEAFRVFVWRRPIGTGRQDESYSTVHSYGPHKDRGLSYLLPIRHAAFQSFRTQRPSLTPDVSVGGALCPIIANRKTPERGNNLKTRRLCLDGPPSLISGYREEEETAGESPLPRPVGRSHDFPSSRRYPAVAEAISLFVDNTILSPATTRSALR